MRDIQYWLLMEWALGDFYFLPIPTNFLVSEGSSFSYFVQTRFSIDYFQLCHFPCNQFKKRKLI